MKTISRLTQILSLSLILIGLMSCTDNTDGSSDDKNKQEIAAEQLKKEYSDYTISNLTWKVSGDYQVANFIGVKTKSEGTAITVWYKVELDEATRQMDIEQLGQTVPDIISDAFNKTPYAVSANWTIEEIELETNFNGNSLEKVYEMELVSTSNSQLEAELYFNAETGALLYSIESLDDDDDDNDDIPLVVSPELKAAVMAVYSNATIIDAEEDDNFIEVKIILSGNTDIFDVELVFTMQNEYMYEEYETTYEKLDAKKFAAVKTWFTNNSATQPTPPAIAEVEVSEAAEGKFITNNIKSIVEVEYEVAGEEYEIEFFLDAQNAIIGIPDID